VGCRAGLDAIQKREVVFFLSGIEIRFFGRSACSRVTVVTVLSRLLDSDELHNIYSSLNTDRKVAG
jgi:hypothetical protein